MDRAKAFLLFSFLWRLALTAPLFAQGLPNDFAMADMDRDGLPDVVAGYSSAVGILQTSVELNTKITFTAHPTVPSLSVTALITPDLNHDGFPDVATVSGTSGMVVIHLNDTHGQVLAGANVSVGSGPTDLAAADFDWDGDPDLAISFETGGQVLFLFNNGSGAFPTNTTGAVGTHSQQVLVGDFNRDGFPDALTVNGGGTNSLTPLQNMKNGTFSSQPAVALGFSPAWGVLGGFDNDGFFDIALSHPEENEIEIRSGNSSFGFGPLTTIPAGTKPRSLVVGDIDSDGDLDLAAAVEAAPPGNTFNGIRLLFNGGQGTAFDGTNGSPQLASAPNRVALADLNRDCVADIVFSFSDPEPVQPIPNTVPSPPMTGDRIPFLLRQHDLGFAGREDFLWRSLDWYKPLGP
jgi:hypothetical protein